jgi:hypothetical protein
MGYSLFSPDSKSSVAAIRDPLRHGIDEIKRLRNFEQRVGYV